MKIVLSITETVESRKEIGDDITDEELQDFLKESLFEVCEDWVVRGQEPGLDFVEDDERKETIDAGNGWSWVFPRTFIGTVLNSNCGNQISLRENKKKHIGLVVTDCDCASNQNYRALDGRKIKVTIETMED